MTYTSVALLVDGDNVHASFAGQIPRKACSACSDLTCAVPPPPMTVLSKLDATSMDAISKVSDPGGWTPVTGLNAHMLDEYEEKISAEPEKTWKAYFKARSDLYDFEQIET